MSLSLELKLWTKWNFIFLHVSQRRNILSKYFIAQKYFEIISWNIDIIWMFHLTLNCMIVLQKTTNFKQNSKSIISLHLFSKSKSFAFRWGFWKLSICLSDCFQNNCLWYVCFLNTDVCFSPGCLCGGFHLSNYITFLHLFVFLWQDVLIFQRCFILFFRQRSVLQTAFSSSDIIW